VVTNKPQQPAEAIVRHLGLANHVRRVVGGDPAGLGSKPDRAASLVAEEGLTGGVFVGDGLDDLHAAERICARFFLAGWGYGTRPVLLERPDVRVLNQPRDLFAALAE
jgi:phosphoglycolate phosphatase